MSYTRTSFKASSSSYRISSDGDDTPLRTSYRSTRSIIDSDDNVSSFRTPRATRTSLADDLGSTRRSPRGFSLDDDSNTISSSVRRSTRLSSRLASEDDDIDSGFTSRRTNRFGSSAGEDEYTISTRRTTRLSSAGDEDFGISSTRSARLTSAGSGDDDYGISSRRLTRLSSSGSTGGDDEFGYSSKRSSKMLSSEWSLKEESDLPASLQRQSSTTSKVEDSSSKYSYRRSQISVDDDDSTSISGFRSTKLSMTYEKDGSGTSSSIVRTSRKSSVDSSREKDGNVYAAILDYSPPRSATDEISLKEGQEVVVLNKDKPHKWKVRTRRTKESKKSEEGYVPSCYLEQKASSDKSLSIEESAAEEQEFVDPRIKEARKKRDAIVKELIETEEDFGRDMQFVANTYLRQLESSITPKELKDVKETLFGCFKDITEFHSDALLKGIQYYAKEPSKIGCTFVRLERDFDKHVRYCRDLPEALKLLENPGLVRDHFEEYSRKIKDDKKLDDHLKLPLQRINDYQLLLKELIKYTSKLDEGTGDLERALELMQAIPQRASDLQYINNIEGYKGNLHKLGRLLKHDWFDVTDSDGNTNERFVLLFKGRMFITDVNKATGPQQTSDHYNVKKIIKLQDVEFDDKDSETIVINSKEPNQSGFPLKLKAKSTEQKETWLKEIKGTNLSSLDDDEDEPMIEDSIKEKLESSQPVTKEPQEEPVAKKAKPEEVKDVEDRSIGRQTSIAQASFEDITDTKASECDAKVEILEDFEAYEEMTTAMTGTLRSESIDEMQSIASLIEDDSFYFTASSELDSAPCKPKVKKTIKSLSEHEGETATIECEIVGYPSPSVQWLKDNKPITAGDHFLTSTVGHKHYLIIKDISPEDVGLYTVAATNSLGTSTSSAAINVLPGLGSPKVDSRPTSPGGTVLPHAPKFKVKLKDTELMDGTTVRFELVVRGMPIPSVKFYKDDKELIEDDRIRVLFESKEVFEIMIDHVTSSDAGIYKCVATNSEGTDETSGKITVTKDKNIFFGIEDQAEPSDGLAPGSTSPRSRSPAFKWFKDGKEFEASERFQVQFDDQEDTIALIFQHVKPEDAGLYTCVASTSSGKISCSAELTVLGTVNTLPRDPQPPTVKVSLADVEVSEGASAMLEAKVVAYPKPKITWYREEEIIETGGRYRFLYEDEESYTLVIKNVKKEDAARYRIHAQNDLGEADTTGKLTVTSSPKFKKQMKDQSVMTDSILKLEVEVEANPAPEVKWFKDGQQLKEGKRIKLLNQSENVYNLVIDKVKLEDAGSYSCVASNELGQQSGFSVVTVNAPPVFVDKLKSAEALEGESAEFRIKVNGNPKPNVKFLQNGQVLKDDGSRVRILDEGNGAFKLVLNKTNPSDAGTYKCVATNDYGQEECDAELTIKLKKCKPNFIKKLQDYEAKENDEMIEFNVKVEGIPQPKIKWLHNNNEIKEKDGFKYVIDEANGSYTLVIPKVKLDKAGKYTCEATNTEGKAETSGLLTVNSPPLFIKKLEDLNVGEGEEVRLNVKVIGSPSPKVKWFKGDALVNIDGKRIKSYEEESAEFTLVINNAVKEDAAVYKAVAENVFGKCETSGKLGVSSKPVFTKLLTDTEAIEYESNIELVVKTDSQVSKPIIKWFIDEQEIKESDKRYKLVANEKDNTYKLVILSATEDLIGRYKCTATNAYGTAETSARFNVCTKPKFLKGLENIEVNEGETVSMTVKIKGSPEPEVKFLKDGRDVSAEATVVVKKEVDDIYILEIENIRIVMSGEYQCHIRNKAGEAFSNGTVVVNSKPKITKDLEDKESWADEDVVLEVVVTGSPTPEITWFKDGKKVKGTERIILESREEVFKLKLDKAESEDTGIYKCKATNKSGSVNSKDAKVTINKADKAGDSGAPVFVKHINDSIAVTGDAIRFEAKVEGNPEPQVSWIKDGLKLEPSDKIQIKDEGDNTHVLEMKDLLIDDTGSIVCKAQNSKGQATDKANLIVQEPESPTIIGLSDVAVLEDEPAKLEAKITGVPKPTVTWYKDGEQVNSNLLSSDPNSDQYCLTIRKVTEDLTGKYICNASNVAGEAQESVELTISGKKPKFTRELEDTITMSVEKEKNKLKLGQNALFEADVIGIPAPTVTWLKNGLEMIPNDRVTITNVDDEHKLEIKAIEKEDVAQYVCKAVNIHGEATSICLLKFQEEEQAPIIKRKLPENLLIEEGNQLCLTARVDGEPMPKAQWTKDGKPIEPSDRVKIEKKPDGTVILTIDNAKIEDSGKYGVKATNPKGEVSSSSEVKVELPQRAPIMQKELPLQIKIDEGKPLNLIAKVDGQPLPQVQWTKDGVPIKPSDGFKIEAKPDGTVALSTDKAGIKDSGVYMVKATNLVGQISSSTTVEVLAPQFAPILRKKLPDSIKVDVGKPLELIAEIDGNPTPEVKWTKDGVPIKPSDGVKIVSKPDGTVALNIDPAKAHDAGQYVMTASSPIGDISCSTAVNVILPQVADIIVKKLPESVQVTEGKPLNLVAQVDGKPLPEVQWTKDGQPLKPSKDVKIETKPDGTVALSIDCAKAQDAGKYAVVVKSPTGEISSSSDVDVQKGDQKAPVIAKKLPDSVQAVEGEPLSLVAKVEGEPISDVKWTKDGVPIKPSKDVKIETKPDGTVSLSIECAKPKDIGKYVLKVKTPDGQISSSSAVNVISPEMASIIVKKLPDSVQVVEGKPLNLVAQVDGKPLPEVQWTKDGQPLKPSKDLKIETKPDGTVALSIDCAKAQDAGKYAVVVKSPTGEVSSSSDVDVQKGDQKAPVIAKKLPDSVQAVEGEPLSLVAKVEGEPISDVKWTKDGVPIKPSKDVKIETKPDGTVSLSIECAKPKDIGKYVLKVKTPDGHISSSSAVNVISPEMASIIVKRLPDSVQVVEGKPLNLVAQVDGKPLPEVQWTKDGQPLKPSKDLKIETKPDGTVALSIDCAQPQDAGNYAVIAKSPSGEVKSSSDVDVLRGDKKPFVFKEQLPDSVNVTEGKPLNLVAKIIGDKTPDVTWSKDGVPIKPSDGVKIEAKPDGTVSLSIDSAQPQDVGRYILSVNTPNGQINSSSDVKVSQAPETGAKKPEFVKSLTPLNVEEGKPCRLECQVKGELSSVSWFKDGQKIVPNEHFGFVKEPNGTIALLIDAVGPQDAGEYRVEVKNNAGEAFSSAPVKMVPKPQSIVREKPVFLEELKPVSVTEGNQLEMKAKIKSDLPVTIKWMKDGVEIEQNDRIKFIQLPDGTAILQINNANLDDAGKYVVVAINDEGRTRSSAAASVAAKVLSKPEITKGLEPVTLTSGQPGKLAVKASGEPIPDVRFIKDGQHVIPNDRVHIRSQPDGTVELVLDEVKPEDQGKYIAVAVNDIGETRSSAPVTVNRAPKFGQPLQETTGIEGYPAKLETKVEGEPKPDLKWTKDGQSLVPDDKHIKTFAGDDGTHTLLFDKCTPDDSGTYGVIASNPFGKTETSAPFTVKSKSDDSGPECEPIFVESLRDVSVNEGEPMVFTARIKASPLPNIKWFLDGQPINASDNILISFDGTKAQLKIVKCNLQHKGLYEIKISNRLGEASSKAAGNITEKSAPKFIQTLSDTEAGITEPLKLECKVKGFPEPDIEWYFNGNRIEPGINYSIFKEGDSCSLVIVRPRDKDSGVYECRARNVCGTDSCKANVTFSDHEGKGEAASFLKKLGDCEVREGKTAKFTACVTGSPRPEIKWFKDGVEFEPSQTKYNVDYQRNGMIRFEIRNVEQSDLGEYRCHATNIHGYDNSTAKLTFESLDDKHKRKPKEGDFDQFKKSGIPVPLPDKPRITRMTDDDLTLSWLPSVPIQPRVPVTYILEWCKVADGEWVVFRTGIKDSQCDVRGLSPGEDYSFRIRVENKFGISDPSPYVTAFRSKLQPPAQPESRKPKDYELEHPHLDKQAAAPRFLRQEEEILYGIRGQPVTIEFWVYAHPDPNVVWYFGGEKIQMGGKYDSLQDRNGQLCLFITRMSESDVGYYSCHAANEHGEATKKIKLLIAEPPVFTKRLEETTVFSHRHARLECTVIGVPEPTVKWFKDWQPIGESNRIKILWESPDRATLFINGAITRDAGLYSCTASNIAGHASTSAMLHVEESEIEYDKYTFGYHKLIKPKTKPIEQFYDIGDELGRGTQGIVYHAVERSSGKSYASKMMHGKDKMKEYMMSELDIMNQFGYHPKLIRLWDAFTSTPHSLTLITDLCGGGELLQCILQKGELTESEVAHYVRQILQGIEYLHFKNIAHFGLTIGDVLVERVNGSDIKIGDFGLAQRLIPGINYYIEFGHPEFVAPEILNKQSATFISDVWSAGIITYILLTGISPFLGANDRETLQNLQAGKIDLLNESLMEISEEGRDFLSKVLVFDPSRRLDVKAALQHPWLRLADRPGAGDQLSCIENLRQYHKRWKSWYANASCKRYYRRRPLHSCFTHPSRMIYPPDERYTPPPSPEREVQRSKFKPSQFDETMKQKISRDPVDAHSESQYQSGPDTYLLQLRDTDFATRIRQYLRVGASRSPSLAASLKEAHWGDANIGYGYCPQVSVRERRKFTDVMDEEIGDEKKGLDTRSKPMRLVREIGTSGYAYGQLHHAKKEASDNLGRETAEAKAPFFREKLKDITIKENDDVVFSCFAVGEPAPSYTWFRNDGVLIESSRIEVKRTNDGRCELRIRPARAYDVGHYKCVARNTEGAVVCRARLKIGDTPSQPEPPEIKGGSNREVYLCWSPPRHDGNSHIVCYKLEYQKIDESNWTVVADNIMHEFYVVKDLEPENSYHFRVTARNKFGWGEPSFLSEVAKTLPTSDCVKIKLPKARIYRQSVTERSGPVIIDDAPLIPDIDYSKEFNPIPLTEEEHNNLYNFVSEISRGRFSLISKTFVKETNSSLVSKAVLTQSEIESGINNEYEIMKSLAHERIVGLDYASRGSSIYVLAMERLSGIDVLTFLSQRQKYSEELVSKIIHQVLDGIEYLHFRGICLLELQPDNVVMIDQRKHDIKLCDFANARRVPTSGSKVSINGTPEYIAPELIKNGEVTKSTDIWCVGVLTYILLSGVSPFRGSNDSETAQNVVYVRYLFDHLYPEITQEAIRFILTIFKLTPHKRPTIEECADHKWLLPNEFMIKKRESALFSSHKLAEFADEFHSAKSCSMPSRLASVAGISLTSESVDLD